MQRELISRLRATRLAEREIPLTPVLHTRYAMRITWVLNDKRYEYDSVHRDERLALKAASSKRSFVMRASKNKAHNFQISVKPK